MAATTTDKPGKKKRIIKAEPSASVDVSKKPKLEELSAKEMQVSLFHTEETEAESRDPQGDVDLFEGACDGIRKLISEIKQLKKNRDKNGGQIESKRVEATMNFMVLKKLNRLTHFRCRKVREGTSEAKMQIDQHHLQLQNLLYEVMHLQKEITKCLEFKSKDEEIELIPVEEFYKEAPEQISKPELTKEDAHLQTLARLDWELEQRQLLKARLTEAQANREKIIQDIKIRKEHLDSLLPKLNSILQATRPVQSYLGMPYDEIREQHHIAYHLPQPLYILYMQSSAYHEACDKELKVSMEGDIDAAKSLDMSITTIEEDSDSDAEDPDKQSAKRRRKTVDARKSDKTDKILKKHPLAVNLEVLCKDGSNLQLTFHYLMVLGIVTVTVKVNLGSDTVISNSISGGDLVSPDSILHELYPGDFGSNTPNPANQFELKRHGLGEFSEYLERVGRPYLWAQWLGGLEFLEGGRGGKPSTAVNFAHMEDTVCRVRKRLHARMELLRQLAALERSSVPVSSNALSLFPAKLMAQLTMWRRSTYVDFTALPYTRYVLDSQLAKETDFFFTAIMSRGSASMTVQVVVTPDYPAVPPLFCVNLAWQRERNASNDNHIQEMEEEVNVHYGELLTAEQRKQGDPTGLLSLCLQRLLMCMDVYLETEINAISGPNEISKEKVYCRIAKGPNRKKPYKFLPALGIFTHRC